MTASKNRREKLLDDFVLTNNDFLQFVLHALPLNGEILQQFD